VPLFDQLHQQWQRELAAHKELIDRIDLFVHDREIAPAYDLVFRALDKPIDATRVVIFGQDPYPTKGHAHGLAFSVDSSVTPLPASLRNIYKELASDCGVTRSDGDLSSWSDQGVMLINRILTTDIGYSLTHENLGWQEVTNTVAQILGRREYFVQDNVITSAHPSPLSAYRGFFGSRPFTQVNEKLVAKGFPVIAW